MITKKSSQIEQKISLEITKDGKPVESVFVGENLIATVKSNMSASSMRVVDCTAHRVGGKTPASVNLIADGCALLPSIMSPMKMTPNGWQSSLSAFRIDGSEQIDIVCILNMCENGSCDELKCPPITSERLARRSLSNDETSIRVDRRLSVKVEEKHADGQMFQAICIEPHLYLPGIALFFGSLFSIAISIILTFRKNRRHDAQVEQLLLGYLTTRFSRQYRTSLPAEIIGPKYIKTSSEN
ncbi:unnamed protein product [Caenorhabditis angaria]|uniref:ZP domain-containing protein n=1 Tax=Caenorhabditis angaria TaxID=860376 RepID=A0A9P1IR02_9PELO|nr:unnamed protein product [Caenorhabditis angaria]